MTFIPHDSMMFFCICLSLKLIKLYITFIIIYYYYYYYYYYSESTIRAQKVRHIVDWLAFRATAVRSMERDLDTVLSSKPTGKVSILEAADTKAVRHEYGFQEIVTGRLLRLPEIDEKLQK